MTVNHRVGRASRQSGSSPEPDKRDGGPRWCLLTGKGCTSAAEALPTSRRRRAGACSSPGRRFKSYRRSFSNASISVGAADRFGRVVRSRSALRPASGRSCLWSRAWTTRRFKCARGLCFAPRSRPAGTVLIAPSWSSRGCSTRRSFVLQRHAPRCRPSSTRPDGGTRCRRRHMRGSLALYERWAARSARRPPRRTAPCPHLPADLHGLAHPRLRRSGGHQRVCRIGAGDGARHGDNLGLRHRAATRRPVGGRLSNDASRAPTSSPRRLRLASATTRPPCPPRTIRLYFAPTGGYGAGMRKPTLHPLTRRDDGRRPQPGQTTRAWRPHGAPSPRRRVTALRLRQRSGLATRNANGVSPPWH